MATIQNTPIVNSGNLYINGFVPSTNAAFAGVRLNISAGICRDSNNIMDIVAGANNPNLEGNLFPSPLSLNTAVVGINGLDTGTLAASTMYAIYVLGDSKNYNPTACILTLASNAQPLMPYGYDSFRKIGYWATNSSSALVAQFVSGTSNARINTYDGPIAFLTAGNSTTAALVSTVAVVPPVDNTKMILQANFTSAAVGDTALVYGGNQVNANATIKNAAAAQAFSDVEILSQLVTGVPEIKYSVTASGDSLTLAVVSYQYYL